MGQPTSPPPFSQLHVLLVEDSEDNQLIVNYHLQNTSTNLDIAKNGKEAVERFTSNQYDLVLMDLQMPVMDGYTATRAIRQWEIEQQRQPIPIIALTASSTEEDLQEALEAGCVDHLTKPLKKEALLNLLNKIYNQSITPQDRTAFSEKQKTQPSQEKYVAILDPDLVDLIPKILEIKCQQALEIQEAVRQGDIEKVRLLGHKMKGSHGLQRVNDLAESIQNAAKRGELSTMQTLTDELMDYLEYVEIRFPKEMI